jgi:hypothetical protein
MEPNQLGTSRLSAERRLHAVESRLEKDPELKVQYHSFMKKYEDLGHMEPVKSQEGKNTCYFLSHHPVFNETSSTTETRVVFDGGAKTSNDYHQMTYYKWVLLPSRICILFYCGSEPILYVSQLT